MKRYVLIMSVLVGFGVALQATASDNSTVKAVMNAQQLQSLSKRPYQTVIVKADAEQPWQDAALRVNAVNQQQALKLHSLSRRIY